MGLAQQNCSVPYRCFFCWQCMGLAQQNCSVPYRCFFLLAMYGTGSAKLLSPIQAEFWVGNVWDWLSKIAQSHTGIVFCWQCIGLAQQNCSVPYRRFFLLAMYGTGSAKLLSPIQAEFW